MFIKGKTKAGKAYGYRMLLSFKTSATYDFIIFTLYNWVRCKPALVGHNSIFCRTMYDVRC